VTPSIRRSRSLALGFAAVLLFGLAATRLNVGAAPPVAAALTGIDLSTYVRVGRFELPEPTRTTAPAGSVLAQEASAVTYNWDTDTLFVVGDGSTSIVQVTKTGQLIDSMTLAPGASPQGTDFYDLEGLAYVGAGRFVMAEERDRQAVLFTYAAGTTLTRANTLTVKLGPSVGNIGIEGISYDPLTNGFIGVKELDPQGIFQTTMDFAAGTATNGSATTEPANLFDPALVGLLDIADVYALSNVTGLTGPQRENILLLSQEQGVIVNVNRSGQISSTLTITNPGSTQPVADQGHEGVAMDSDGVLYVVSENGGGDVNHPELWVYAPSSVTNQPPAGVTLTNVVSSLLENTATATRLKLADVVVNDDGLGTNNLTVTGSDATAFEVDASGLYIKAGTVLDFETKPSYSVSVNVDDPSIGASPDATVAYTLTVTDVANEVPPTPATIAITEVTPWASGNAPYAADWFELTNTGTAAVDITGWKFDDDSNLFGNAVALTGVTLIQPGESVIFMEAANLASAKAAFLSAWFGASPPASLQVGGYSGSGVGLGTGGDQANVFDAAGNRVTGVKVGTSTAGFTFDNAARIGSSTPPPPEVTTLSVAGVNGAFLAADGIETGSPGRITSPPVLPPLKITEVTPWSSGNSPYGADWFEVTNFGATPVDITGYKIDDNSNTFASAVALTGVTTIKPGESVIFMETNNLAQAKPAFLSAWFGTTPPATLQVGAYSGSGVGLSTDGDAVNLFDASGNRVSGISVGKSTTGFTFDNAAGLGTTTLPLPLVTTLSISGISGAFVASDGAVGSPGLIVNVDKTPPVIAEVTPIVVEATSAQGATVQYVAPATLDDFDGAGVAQCLPIPGTVFALGVTTVACTAQDAAGNSASSTFTVTVRDTTPPVVTVPANISVTATLSSGVAVSFSTSASDIVSGSTAVSCTPASGSVFAVGVTTVMCRSTDIAGNTGSASFSVTVLAPPSTPDGRIYGIGHLDNAGAHHHFAFRVAEIGRNDYGRFEYWVSDRRSCDRDDDDYDHDRGRNGERERDYGRDRRKATGRFEATAITSVVFSDDPRFRPGRSFFSAPPKVDSVTFVGTGKWNGKAGYTFRVTAADRGEPGRRHDTFTLVIQDSRGRIVASVDDTLDGGNIQSTRLGWFGLFGWFF
jgi:uncharacterized protein YjiK